MNEIRETFGYMEEHWMLTFMTGTLPIVIGSIAYAVLMGGIR